MQEQRDLGWERTRALEMLSREVMLLDTFVAFGLHPSPALLSLELRHPNPSKLTALNGKSTEGREQATRHTAPLSASGANDLVAVMWPFLLEGAGAKKQPSVLLKARVGKKADSSSSFWVNPGK